MAIPSEVLKKYDDFDLSGYSAKILEKMIMDAEQQGWMICFPWKPEHDPLGQDTPWFDNGETVLIDLGAMNCECDIHAENRKHLEQIDHEEEDRLYWERKGMTPPAPVRKEPENEDIGIDTSKYFGEDGIKRFLKDFMD